MPAVIFGLYPAMHWSWSRFTRLLRCARAYYWRHYATHLGWTADAPPESRAAYVRSKLVPLQAAVGAVVHARAAECVIALRDGAPMPTVKVMLDRSRADLNALVLSSRRRDAFLRRPKPGFMLLEMWRDGRLAPDDVDNATTPSSDACCISNRPRSGTSCAQSHQEISCSSKRSRASQSPTARYRCGPCRTWSMSSPDGMAAGLF